MISAPEKHLSEVTISRRRNRQIKLIVAYLMQSLRIPEDKHLVTYFGNGRERDNREALTNWVEKHLNEINPDEARQRLKQLARKSSNSDRGQ